MRRLTISPQACAETLAILVAFAWADERMDDREKASLRGAATVFNLTQAHRDQLDALLAKPSTLDAVHADRLSPRDRDFAYVAAVWMSKVDDEVAGKEEGLLWRLADMLGIGDERKTELESIAGELKTNKNAPRQWGDEVARLFRAIPPRLEPIPGDGEIEITFE